MKKWYRYSVVMSLTNTRYKDKVVPSDVVPNFKRSLFISDKVVSSDVYFYCWTAPLDLIFVNIAGARLINHYPNTCTEYTNTCGFVFCIVLLKNVVYVGHCLAWSLISWRFYIWLHSTASWCCNLTKAPNICVAYCFHTFQNNRSQITITDRLKINKVTFYNETLLKSCLLVYTHLKQKLGLS